jgi:subtilisin family serine protease
MMLYKNAVVPLLAALCACADDPGAGKRDATLSSDSVLVARLTRLHPERAPDKKMSAALRRQLAELPPEAELSVVVDLRDQLDPRRLAQQIGERPRLERRRAAVDIARRIADASQRRLQPLLDSLTGLGVLREYRRFTVANRIVVTATSSGIHALAKHSDVASILTDRIHDPRPETPIVRRRDPSSRTMTPATERDGRGTRRWPLIATRADSAHRLGLTGAGVAVGLIDAGASAEHDQLRQNFRGGSASWFDPHGRTTSPTDALQGHGTGILSLAVGRASTAGASLGIAAGATWVACVGLPEGRYDEIAVTECAEWIFTTAQPDVLIAPWLIEDTSCDRSLEPIVNSWRAAEILPVFAAGNEGPSPGTGGSPANYVALYPGGAAALSVGGLRRNRAVLARSSRGPNHCGGGVYPTIVAPAEDLDVAYPLTRTMIVRTTGTSYAAAVVAGAAALLLERHPESSVLEIEQALRSGARDLGRPGPDNDFGFGALDVPQAIAALDSIRRTPAARR